MGIGSIEEVRSQIADGKLTGRSLASGAGAVQGVGVLRLCALGIFGSFSIFENIKPPGIIAAHYTHVIGNNANDLPHSMTSQLGDEVFIVSVVPTSGFKVL